MTFEVDDTAAKNVNNKPEGHNLVQAHELLLACVDAHGITWSNPFRCGQGTATPFQAEQLKKDPRYVDPQAILKSAEKEGGVVLQNPYAGAGDSVSHLTDGFKSLFDSEKANRGNKERQLVADYRQNTAAGTANANAYASLIEVATAAGEASLGRGSQVQYLPSVDASDPSYPRYVLTDKGYYDLGSTALDYLYTASAAMKDLRRYPGVDTSAIATQDKRITWDINTVLDKGHDMNQVVREMAGPVYKAYGDRFHTWKESIIDKFNYPEKHIFDNRMLDANMIAKYQAKAVRDLAVIDMALLKNNAGNRQKLIEEINDYLNRAAKRDPNNPDFKQLQKIAGSL